jgi:hypothetical protein
LVFPETSFIPHIGQLPGLLAWNLRVHGAKCMSLPVHIKEIQSYPKDCHTIFFILYYFYFFTLNILALMATTIVLTVIKTAPAAGLNKISCLYNDAMLLMEVPLDCSLLPKLNSVSFSGKYFAK